MSPDRLGYEDSAYGSVDNDSFTLETHIYRVMGLYSDANGSVVSLTALVDACEYLPTQLRTVSFLVNNGVHSGILDYANDGCHVDVGFTERIFEGLSGQDVQVILRVLDRTVAMGSVEGQGFHEMLCTMPTNILGEGACTPIFMGVFSLFFAVMGSGSNSEPTGDCGPCGGRAGRWNRPHGQ